jgi:putative ABC transport system permease protein
MLISILERKLLRELSRLKGQIATIALVVASGIVAFISLRGTYASIEASRSQYYDSRRFADVFATATRVPDSAARALEQIAGVAAVETRIVKEITVPIEEMPRPAYGRLLSLPEGREPLTNALYLRRGRLPERGRPDEVVVLESFATAHGLSPGDWLPAVINGKLRHLSIVGVALSPEFVFAIRPGALAHDARRYAVVWMGRRAAAAAYDLDGAFNEVSVRLEPGASAEAVRAELDRLLSPFGGDGAFARKDQISHRVLSEELGQLSTLSTMIPLIFLGVAVFLVNLVLGRLVRLQRPEIATLKAIGYSNRAIALHYLGLVIVVIVPGAALGTVGGLWLGRIVLGMYASSFRFPDLRFIVPPSAIASAVLASSAAALVGALGAVRGAVRLPPAEAMRPPAPAAYRRSWLDRSHVSALVGQTGMMVLREVQRRPLRTALSSTGIAGAAALLILGHFGIDSLAAYFDVTYTREQRQDLQVVFDHPLSPRAARELANLPGVRRAEGVRAVPIRVRRGHRWRESLLMGLGSDATLRRMVGRDGVVVPLPPDGVVVSRMLAEVLGLRIGDRPEVQIREGERSLEHPVVVGFVDDSVGLTLYARHELVASLERDLGALSSVLLAVEPDALGSVEARLRRSPHVIDVSDLRADMNRLFEMNASIMDVWTAISVALAASLVFGVVYNNARIAASARSRELASLRVLGFSRREVSAILLYGLAIEVALAIPLGLWLGRLWSARFMQSMNRETFRWELVVAPQTYLLAVAVVSIAAACSALWVRRNLDRLDLIAVLKSRE